MINTGTILTAVQTRMHDNSAALRARMIEWLNQAISSLHDERDWLFTEKSVDLVSGDSAIAKPSDFAKFRFAKSEISGSEYFLSEKNRLTEEEATNLGDGDDPTGFTENASQIMFFPGITGTVTLGYYCTIPEYTDNATTILPDKFSNVLKAAVLASYYEYDVDSRLPSAQQSYALELNRLKKGENLVKPIPKRNSRGYIR